MEDLKNIIKSVRPDMSSDAHNQISMMLESLVKNQVDPNLVAFNIMVLCKIYEENPGIKFVPETTEGMQHKTIRFIVNKWEFDELERVSSQPYAYIENALMNECVGEVNLDIDATGKSTFYSEGIIDRIWKEEKDKDNDAICVMMHYALR